MVLVALINLNEGGVTRRRMLLTSTTGADGSMVAPGTGAATVEYGVSVADLMAEQLGVPADHASRWSIAMRLTPAQACMADADLRAAMRAALLAYLPRASASVADVGVSFAAVSAAGVSCPAGRRAAESRRLLQEATAQLDAVIVFRAGSQPSLSLTALRAMPGLLSIQPVSVPAVISLSDSTGALAGSSQGGVGGAAEDSEKAGGGGSKTALVAAASTVACVLFLGAGGAAVWVQGRRRRAGAIGEKLARLGSDDGAQVATKVEAPQCGRAAGPAMVSRRGSYSAVAQASV